MPLRLLVCVWVGFKVGGGRLTGLAGVASVGLVEGEEVLGAVGFGCGDVGCPL